MVIVLFGGSGCLGVELKKLNPKLICPPSYDVDISDLDEVKKFIDFHKPDIVINAAAKTDNRVVEKNACNAIETNIIGAANVAMVCTYNDIRLVYISTDYIYKGDKGNYKEIDEILPFNIYSWTKLGGECSTVAVKNHLIIRTSFGSNFKYNEAFIDKWSSKDYVDKIAPLIYEAAISPLTGVLNLGTERKTLYDHAVERNETVSPVKIADTNYHTPYDTSLNLQKWINYKGEKSIAKPHCNCRVCGSDKLTKYLDLGLMPLANNLEFTAQRAKEKERFPLQVMFCEFCGLSQLSVVIDPEKMFSYYTYRSAVNTGYIKHCRKMAAELQERFDLSPKSFMIDIAGNDGTLLNQFKEEIGLKVLNVDPATNLTAIAESIGVESYTDFWSLEVSNNIIKSHGKADLITATNVFAHVDNVREFILSAKNLLKENGVLVLEFPYLIDFIEDYEFDTVYFEHLSYFSILPLVKLCEITEMRIISVEKQNIHGGTVRVTISHKDSSIDSEESVLKFIDNEINLGYDKIEKYNQWTDSVNEIVNNFSDDILELKKQGYKIAAFAASAKGNTLLNRCSMNTDIISYIADETPEKIGKYSPGTGIPIVNKQMLIKDAPDYLIILSWNFKEEIISKLDKIYKGKYIIPNEYEKAKS
jgi:dTDP-4-dehydrorhamnose reductase/SAM-dependent methyltransferase